MRLLNKLIFAALLLNSTICLGKTGDARQPIHIEADAVEIREQEGISIYRGNVSITRGSMVITGELIYIHSSPQGLEKIIVEGKPASFRQLNDVDEEISAQSQHMTYMADNGLLVMKQEAVLVQNQNKFTSEHIVYNTRKDIVQAGGEQPSADSDTPQRVTITIQPPKDDQPRDDKQTP